MEKLLKVLESIESITKAEDDELKDLLSDFPIVDKLVDHVTKYEKKIAKLLKNQRKHFIDGVKSLVAKDAAGDVLLLQFLQGILPELFESDKFEEEMSEASKAFLLMTVPEITEEVMELIDKDVSFNTLSKRTTDWIEDWSNDLGSLMKLTSHNALEKQLLEGIELGEGIPKIVDRLKDLPEFNRKRAYNTAVTEVLTASSYSQKEAYDQSPSVTGKTWLHSGTRMIKPRPHHQDLHDNTIPLDEKWSVGGFSADVPRDVGLPAKERVRCHCAMAPSVDEQIFGLSKERKEEIRQQVLRDLNGE